MCDRSNRPAAERTARCSSRMPPYWIGISQPANSTIFAPSASWRSSSGVGVGAIGSGLGHAALPSPSIASGNVPSVAATRRAGDERALRLERQQGRRLVEADPAHLVELVVVTAEVAAGRGS